MYALSETTIDRNAAGSALRLYQTRREEIRERLIRAGLTRVVAERRVRRITRKRGRSVREKLAQAAADMFSHYLQVRRDQREFDRAACMIWVLFRAAEISLDDVFRFYDDKTAIRHHFQ